MGSSARRLTSDALDSAGRPVAQCAEMHQAHRVLVPVLLCVAVLLGGLPSTHVHDGSTAGLYSAECPSSELARHSLGLPLSSPAAASLDLAPVALTAAVDEQVPRDLPATATPRAPPLS
jgi:hypothetical protein